MLTLKKFNSNRRQKPNTVVWSCNSSSGRVKREYCEASLSCIARPYGKLPTSDKK